MTPKTISRSLSRSLSRSKEHFDAKPVDERRWWVLWTVMLGTLISLLDATIVNVSIPAIMADFNESVPRVQWVVSAYMIAFAVLTPVTGWLLDRLGTRTLYLSCLAVFTAGSLLCGIAWNLESLVVFRVIQAFGGGAMTPIAMGIIVRTFPAKEKGKALGIWGAGVLIGPMIGPPLGGVLTNEIGWRSIFLVNLPIGFIGVLAAYLILRPDRDPGKARTPFDFAGFSLFSGFLIALLYGASQVESGGFAGVTVYLCGLLSIGFLLAFLVSEMRSGSRLFDFSLFRSRVFSLSIGVSLVRSFALYGGQFLLPLFFARVHGYAEDRIGFMILPGALLIGVLFPFTGGGSDRYGSRPFIISGLGILVAFFVCFSFLTAGTSFWGLQVPILVRGIGLGLLVTPLNSLALGSVPPARTGNASVLLNLSQQLGGSLGIAVLGGILELQTHRHATQGLDATEALVAGFRDSFRVGGAVCAVALLLALALPRRTPEIFSKELEKEPHGTA
jgi:EmrB/QacA subfamily drug resistance transporter